MQLRSDTPFALRRAGIVALCVTVAACSTPSTQPKVAKQAAASVVQPARVDIQQDATGFTILEDVRVSTDVRAEYENAVRLLEQQQYEAGVSALVKVTQAAPNVTAAHIDLGIGYARSGELAKAEESLQRALQL